jgi:hypothetical protein
MAGGSAASLLSQVLCYGLLPLAGALIAPERALAPIPLAALLVGAVAATFPAAILTDAFGRRAAFALGASLGAAGGLVAAFAILKSSFPPLVLGAFWLGLANGFALQYRHAAAASRSADAARAVAIVVGCGVAVGLVAPSLAAFVEAAFTPVVGVGTALLAAAAHVAALALAMALPADLPTGITPPPEAASAPGAGAWFAPTLAAALAWFGMTAVMAYAPLGLAGCGVAFGGVLGAVAWHVVAMYAPALALGPALRRIPSKWLISAGLALIASGVAAIVLFPAAAPIVAALVAVGAGWSLATTAALVALHRAGPSRLALAGHDAAVLAAAVAGALAAGQIAL